MAGLPIEIIFGRSRYYFCSWVPCEILKKAPFDLGLSKRYRMGLQNNFHFLIPIRGRCAGFIGAIHLAITVEKENAGGRRVVHFIPPAFSFG
jgi:hypothetical protein